MSNNLPIHTAGASLSPDGVLARLSSIRRLKARVLSGSAIMLLSSVFVGGMNLIYNFAIAHTLGADQFGHASVVYTMLMLLSSVTLSFQLMCSKFVARSESETERVAIYHLLHRRAWICSAAIGAAITIASPVISEYLNLPARSFIYLLAAAPVFYIPLGVRRGFMQGTYSFRSLAANFVLEVIVKLLGAVVLISAGYGVEGVVAAMTASVVGAYCVAIPREHRLTAIPQATLPSATGEGVQALTFFIGQVIINNLDIILVKHFFDATAAGVYAAVALAGRVVYMLSWSVISGMFPFSAGVRSEEHGGHAILSTCLLLVVMIATVFTLGVWLAPSGLWQILLGHGFPVPTRHFYSSLLVLYSITTAIYSLAVVLMTYEISRRISNTSWLQLGFSGAIIIGIYLFHHTLHQVITVQLVLMLALMLLVSLPFVRNRVVSETVHAAHIRRGIRKIKRVQEDEVIAEFLKGEFYLPEFGQLRAPFADLVSNPDLTNQRDNSLRRALLYRRRGRLWRELPQDTEWWEVELTPEDILRTRVFPRNQWLRYGAPGFLLLNTTENIRDRILSNSSDPFIVKLRELSVAMAQSITYSSIILITINPQTPLTLIEGNHRMTAAALVSPDTLHTRFRFLCGFSAHMAECCWYQTDVATLWHYAKNTLAYYLKHRREFNSQIWQRESGESSDEAGIGAA